MNPEDIVSTLRAVWGFVEGAVAEKQVTADLWTTLRAGAEELGVSTEGWDIFQVNYLRSNAASLREASRVATEALQESQRLGIDRGIQGDAVAAPWWGRGALTQEAGPLYQIRAEVLIENPLFTKGVPGEPQFTTEWVTAKTNVYPSTVNEVTSLVDKTAQEGGVSPRKGYAGVASIQIMQV